MHKYRMTTISNAIATADKIIRWIGLFAAWLLIPMVLVESLVVILRYGFEYGSIAMQESVTYLHACCFMLGAAYALQCDEHVRVDIFYREFSATKQAWVNLLGALFFVLPFCGFVITSSLEYVEQAWRIKEASADSGGIAGVYLLKSLIPLLAVLLGIQALAEIARNTLLLFSSQSQTAISR